MHLICSWLDQGNDIHSLMSCSQHIIATGKNIPTIVQWYIEPDNSNQTWLWFGRNVLKCRQFSHNANYSSSKDSKSDQNKWAYLQSYYKHLQQSSYYMCLHCSHRTTYHGSLGFVCTLQWQYLPCGTSARVINITCFMMPYNFKGATMPVHAMWLDPGGLCRHNFGQDR